MSKEVVVVIGAGGIGQAIGRREGTGRHVLLADRNEDNLGAGATVFEAGGHEVSTHRVDVASRESVHALANAAGALGDVTRVIHTAGLSPVQASPEAILAVDLYGVAVVQRWRGSAGSMWSSTTPVHRRGATGEAPTHCRCPARAPHRRAADQPGRGRAAACRSAGRRG